MKSILLIISMLASFINFSNHEKEITFISSTPINIGDANLSKVNGIFYYKNYQFTGKIIETYINGNVKTEYN